MSDEAKHTPGPWTIGYGGMAGDGYFVITSTMVPGIVTEYTVPAPWPDAEVRANANLIAASPDLLAACEAFARWDEDPHASEADASSLRKVVADAIARAKGGAR